VFVVCVRSTLSIFVVWTINCYDVYNLLVLRRVHLIIDLDVDCDW
jgi:hypothetical protein